MTDDEINAMFENINPEDFTATTSATYDEAEVISADEFVARQVYALRFAFAAAEGNINTMTVLGDGTHRRIFRADADETLGDYIARLAREARAMEADWLFFARRTQVGVMLAADVGDEKPPIDSAEMHAQADSMGTVRDAFLWYFEARKPGPIAPTRRSGFLVVEDERRLAPSVESTAPQALETLNPILHD